MAESAVQVKFRERVRQLPRAEKVLLGAFFSLGTIALVVGGISAVLLVAKAGGFLALARVTTDTFLTLHVLSLFYYWFYPVLIAVTLTGILVYTEGAHLTAGWRGLAWAGFILIAIGFTLGVAAVLSGATPTYAGLYPLIKQYGVAGVIFYLGYILKSVGLILAAVAGIATAIRAKLAGTVREWTSIAFASTVWLGLLIVTAVAALLTYIPPFQDMLGQAPFITPINYSLSWGIMFHNFHYLPIMGAVLVWYALAEITTGVKSIYGERFSKGIFALYLFVVPPTSIYHMFLEPGIPQWLKVIGSVLSLGVSIPTIAMGMVILTSLHACASRSGDTPFSWLRRLPWQNPSFTTLAVAMVSALAGGVIANVIIQPSFEQALGDSFTVPGYFHFFTMGAVSLALFGFLIQMIPALTGHRLWASRLFNPLAWTVLAGLLIFGAAGIIAGYAGVPRRTLEYSFLGNAPGFWNTIMVFVGIGGLVMAAAAAIYAILLLIAALRSRPFGVTLESLPTASFNVEAAAGKKPWSSFVVVTILLVAIYGASLAIFQVLNALPAIFSGGGH